MQCPLNCNDKDFKRLELHLGMVHGKEVIEAFTNKVSFSGYETMPNNVAREIPVSNPICNNPTADVVRNPSTVPSSMFALKQMYAEMNEMLMLRVQQQELLKALRGDAPTQQVATGLDEFLKLQKVFDDRIDKMKKEIQEQKPADNNFEMQMLMNVLGGLNNAKPKPDTNDNIVDTGTA